MSKKKFDFKNFTSIDTKYLSILDHPKMKQANQSKIVKPELHSKCDDVYVQPVHYVEVYQHKKFETKCHYAENNLAYN